MRWEHVAYVESENDNGEYEIKRHPNTGALGCTCGSYRFSKGVKTCKHLVAYHAGDALHIFGRHGGTSSIKVAEDTYTFKRGISFSPI